MGLSVSRVSYLFCGKRKIKLLILGVDYAGRTAILTYLKLGEAVQTLPSISHYDQTVDYKNFRLTTWDMSSKCKLREAWKFYYPGTDGVVFVIDSADCERLDEAKCVLKKLFYEDELKNAVFLVFANKQDLSEAMTVSELTDKLQLHQVKDKKWHVQGVSAINGMGLYEGFDWLCNEICRS